MITPQLGRAEVERALAKQKAAAAEVVAWGTLEWALARVLEAVIVAEAAAEEVEKLAAEVNP